MRRTNRLIKNSADDHDPVSMLTNLFDVAMVFAVALMVAMVVKFNMTEIFSKEDYTIVKNPGQRQYGDNHQRGADNKPIQAFRKSGKYRQKRT